MSSLKRAVGQFYVNSRGLLTDDIYLQSSKGLKPSRRRRLVNLYQPESIMYRAKSKCQDVYETLTRGVRSRSAVLVGTVGGKT